MRLDTKKTLCELKNQECLFNDSYLVKTPIINSQLFCVQAKLMK